MHKSDPKKQNPTAPRALPAKPAVRWVIALLAAVALGVGWAYYWRVFYYLDARFAPLATTGLCVGAAVAVVAVVALLRRMRCFAVRGAVCVLLCGLLFAFANPPLQTPDETDHYLRTYAISQGRFDFDAERVYPDDVAALVHAFPGAWVNAHTSVGVGADPDTGTDKPYDTAGYALKQYGSDGALQSVADSFADYFDRTDTDTVTEPISFVVLPFVPGAIGMAVARLFGLGALGCLYGGRIANLAAYALLCFAALKSAQRARPLFLCVMLLPLSLFIGASLSYDATLLGCYYLMLALLTRDRWTTRTAAAYAAACVFVNVAKPYLNLLWTLLPLLLCAKAFCARGRRWHWTAGMLGGALGATMLGEWYGRSFRYHYDLIARQGGQAVDGMAQLVFVLSNPLRTAAAFWGTLCENEFFVGQLGLFGWKDLPVSLLNLTGPLVLLAGALLSATPGSALGRRRTVGLGVWALVYAAGTMTAMYITYTPVGMVRIVGLQARYFLAVFLVLALCAAALLRRTLAPAMTPARAQAAALPLFAGYAALGAVLLFQHYFVGPFYTIPA